MTLKQLEYFLAIAENGSITKAANSLRISQPPLSLQLKGLEVFPGMKCGDVDPRANAANCLTASDKALAVGGGVLEALLHFGCLPDPQA